MDNIENAVIEKLLKQGMASSEIALLFDLDVQEVRRIEDMACELGSSDAETMVKVSLNGGAFELETGIPWTVGLSPYRDKERYNLRFENGRWHFEVNGREYSAKQVSPSLKDIQTVREGL